MHFGFFLNKVRTLFSIPEDQPDLVKAQCVALSNLMPPMYFVLVANSWGLSASFYHTAPRWLTVYFLAALNTICVIRLISWWKQRKAILTPEKAVRRLRQTNKFAAILAVGFSWWALSLYPYGNAYARSLVAFFLAMTVFGAIFCLVHVRSAALLVAGIITTAFIGFFVATGNRVFIAMSINIALVTITFMIVIWIQNHDFKRMILAQSEALALISEQDRLMRMIDDMPVAVMTVDPATFNINYINETSKRTFKQIEDLLPIKSHEVLGSSIDVFHRHPEYQRKILSNPANLPHYARIQLGPEVLDLQISAVRATDGSYIGPMLTWSIVTQQAEAERRIRQLAHYDTLTGLANRTTFREKLEESMKRQGAGTSLLFVDLDGFKLVNDSRGHLVGDALLKQVAGRIRTKCNQNGIVVGRLGGDEFAILMEDATTEQAAALAGSLVEALVAPYNLEGDDRRTLISASIGIALSPKNDEEAETLLAHADIALYAAKASGKGRYRVFSPEMEQRIQDRVRLESKLRTALEEEDGLFVFYQPIVDIRTGRVTAREALIRWHHPERGWVAPVEFIPVAEQSGLIDKLGRLVLRRACCEAVSWSDGARVAVNVSPGQLGRDILQPSILEALALSGLEPDRLEVEVTESALLNDELDCIGDLRSVHELGVHVALDDFGTGFSSLAHIRAFPFDKIKIDGSFVRDAVDRPDCAAVVKVIADLGKRLGVTTVAEGVETEAHLECVIEEGCTEVQGYYFGRPAPSENEASLVRDLV